jgi:DNA-binding transcriptional LysR family regulator
MDHFEIYQLRHFVAAVSHGHISRAAHSLGLSQPALSRSIKKMEDSMGVSLLERTPFGVRPTDYGESLSHYARAILTDVDTATREIAAMQGKGKGEIRIGITSNFDNFITPDVIARFRESYPNIFLTFVTDLPRNLFMKLKQGEIDLAFSFLPADPDVDLNYIVLLRSRFAAFVGKEHPLAKRKTIVLSDLAKYDWVVFDDLSVTKFFRIFFHSNNVTIPRLCLKMNSVQLMMNVVTKTDLVAVLPETGVAKFEHREALREIKVRELTPDYEAGIITRQRRVQTPTTKHFIALVRAACAEALRSDADPPRTHK